MMDFSGNSKALLNASLSLPRSMANVLVHFLRQKEAESEELGEDDASAHVRRNDVVNWYLGETAKDSDSQEELRERKQIVEKVLDRLAYQDNVLLPLSKTQLGGDAEHADNPVLVVHPNYVIDA